MKQNQTRNAQIFMSYGCIHHWDEQTNKHFCKITSQRLGFKILKHEIVKNQDYILQIFTDSIHFLYQP